MRPKRKSSDDNSVDYSSQSLDELEELIDGNSLDASSKVDAIESYLQKLPTEAGKTADLIESSFMTFVRSIHTDGIRNNDFVTYLKNYIKAIDAPLQESTAQIVQSVLEKGLVPNKYITDDKSFLYDARMYDGGANKNNYKVKSCLFLSNPGNVKQYGMHALNSSGEPTKKYLTPDDILAINDEDKLKAFLGKSQTKAPGDTSNEFSSDDEREEKTGYQIVKDAYGVSTLSKAQVTAYIKTLLQNNKYSEENIKGVINVLNSPENHDKLIKLLNPKYGSALSDDSPMELFNAKVLSWLSALDVSSGSDWRDTAVNALTNLGVSKKKINDIMKQFDEESYSTIEDFLADIISRYDSGV